MISGEQRAQGLVLRLYVAGNAARSRDAIVALSDLCAGPLAGRAKLEIIDVRREPERGEEAEVIGLPTVVKQYPLPERRVAGDLSHGRRVLSALGIELPSSDG